MYSNCEDENFKISSKQQFLEMVQTFPNISKDVVIRAVGPRGAMASLFFEDQA